MPAGGPTAASSLYSGIFSKNEEKNGNADGSLSMSIKEGEGNQARSKADGSIADNASSPKEKEDASSAKPQAWSAALRFAPRKNASQPSKPRRPLPSSLVSATFSAAPIAIESEQVEISESTKAAEVRIKPSIHSTSSEHWNKIGQSSQAPQRQVQIDALRVNKADESASYSLPLITAPPELNIPLEELEKDRVLFAELAEQRGEGKRSNDEDISWYDDDEEVEDVNGFGSTDAGRRARKKKSKRKRNNSPSRQGPSTASLKMDADYDVRLPNDYSQFKELVRKRREAVRRVEKARKAQEDVRKYEDDSDDMIQSDAEEDNNDDAYRRSKMNRFAPPSMYNAVSADPMPLQNEEDDEKPYLSPPPSVPPVLPLAANHAAPSAQETGEEAYLRRLAMSQGTPDLRNAPVIETQSEPVPSPANLDFAARAAAAAAIAAKLAKAVPTHTQTAPAKSINMAPSFVTASHSSIQDASFAQRLMEKQGWKEGEALGAEGNKGLIDPILAKKVEAARAKQRDLNEKQSTSNRGTLINTHEEEKRREEREKFGTPSEVILLENMVDLEDIDDELSDEIGEECAKNGYVQRVFIWPQGPKGVRIFVKFSGMAGAWRCVKELEGRFFGGKTVRARYYPLIDFERGNYMKTYNDG